MKKMEKVGKWEKKILENLTMAGSASFIIFCDQMADFLKINNKSQFNWKMNRSFVSLEKRGLITNDNKLTTAGQQIIDDQKLQTIKLVKPKKWDGRWRVVMFDIPEEFRRGRNRFRRKLKELDFTVVQKSVFKSKLPCVTEIYLTAKLLGIEKFVQIIEGDFVAGIKNEGNSRDEKY